MDELSNFSVDTTAFESHSELLGTGFEIGGWMDVECWNKDGVLVWTDRIHNIIPNLTLNDILNVYYAASAATPTFYMMMVDNAGFSAFAATDTMASHTGWVENTNCSNATRPVWTPGAASAQSIVNPAQVVFNMNPSSPVSIRGFALTSNSTLGGTTGNLVATAALSAPQPANGGDTLKVTYTIAGTTS